jgi:hypothetical protein
MLSHDLYKSNVRSARKLQKTSRLFAESLIPSTEEWQFKTFGGRRL